MLIMDTLDYAMYLDAKPSRSREEAAWLSRYQMHLTQAASLYRMVPPVSIPLELGTAHRPPPAPAVTTRRRDREALLVVACLVVAAGGAVAWWIRSSTRSRAWRSFRGAAPYHVMSACVSSATASSPTGST